MKYFSLMILLIIGNVYFSINYEVSYIHQKLSLDQVKQLDKEHWIKTEEDIYAGLDNGIYWFRIELSSIQNPHFLSIPNCHITRARLYTGNNEITRMKRIRHLVFRINNSPINEPFFLWVDCNKEAHTPIQIQNHEEFRYSAAKENLIIGLYNGIVIAIIVFNLLSFFIFKDNNYIYYVFTLIAISLVILYRDGSIFMVLENHQINEFIEIPIDFMVTIGYMLLCNNYLQLGRSAPMVKRYMLLTLFLSAICFIIFIVTRHFLLFIITDLILLAGLTSYWIVAIYQFRRSVYARIITLAYGPLLLFAYDHYIFPRFGIHSLEVPLNVYRLGGIIDILVFSYAITYKGKRLSKENREMRSRITIHAQGFKTVTNDLDLFLLLEEKYDLTEPEARVLKAVSEGNINKEIAEKLFVSVDTVKLYIRSIYEKLEIPSDRKKTSKNVSRLHMT